MKNLRPKAHGPVKSWNWNSRSQVSSRRNNVRYIITKGNNEGLIKKKKRLFCVCLCIM